MKRMPLLLLVLSALFQWNCSRDMTARVNQDSIYTEFSLIYDAETDQTSAQATFRFEGVNGSSLQLSDPAEVRADGALLDWDNMQGLYKHTFSGKIDTAQFVYTDLAEGFYENDILLAKPIIAEAVTLLPRGEAFELRWQGAALGNNESVLVTVQSGEAAAKVFTTIQVGATSIVLDQAKLADLPAGAGTLRIERWATLPLEQTTTQGGAGWSRFLAAPISIDLE